MKIVQSSPDVSIRTPEEKKRRMEGEMSPPKLLQHPQPLITLVPTGSTPLSMARGMVPGSHSVISMSGTGNQQILLAPNNGGPPILQNGSQIIPNGTLNGLPMFQIVNNQTLATSQPAQFVAIAQSQGRSLLTNTPQSLLSPQKGVPVLMHPVTVTGSPQLLMSTPTKLGTTSIAKPLFGNQPLLVSTTMHSTAKQQHSVLKQTLNSKNVILGNNQVLGKQTHKEISSVPNGLYPVTPPKTPEEPRSESGSQDTAEESEVSLFNIFLK